MKEKQESSLVQEDWVTSVAGGACGQKKRPGESKGGGRATTRIAHETRSREKRKRKEKRQKVDDRGQKDDADEECKAADAVQSVGDEEAW